MVFFSGFCTSISFWVGFQCLSSSLFFSCFYGLFWLSLLRQSLPCSVTASLAFLFLVWLQLNMSECFITPCFTNHTPLLYTNTVINKRACSYQSTLKKQVWNISNCKFENLRIFEKARKAWNFWNACKARKAWKAWKAWKA